MPRSSSRLRRIIRATRSRREGLGCPNCGDPDRFGYLHTPVGSGTCLVTLPVPATVARSLTGVIERKG